MPNAGAFDGFPCDAGGRGRATALFPRFPSGELLDRDAEEDMGRVI